MRRMLVTYFIAMVGLAGWAGPSNAGLFSSTGPVIAIVAGDLFLGEAKGHLDGSGTMTVQSRATPEVTCRGQFTSSAELGGVGDMRCDDGTTATFRFQRLTLFTGHGTGSTGRGTLSFTYGLTASESEPYLALPVGKALRLIGKDLVLVSVVDADGKVTAREVNVGVMNRVSAQIISGLEPGEKVVVGTRATAPVASAQTNSSLTPNAARSGGRP